METGDVIEFRFEKLKKKVGGLVYGTMRAADGTGLYKLVKVTKSKYHFTPLFPGRLGAECPVVRTADREVIDLFIGSPALDTFVRLVDPSRLAVLFLVS